MYSTAERLILAVMVPGVWYSPRQLKQAAGIQPTDADYGDILTRMSDRGLIQHGNGITTHGFALHG